MTHFPDQPHDGQQVVDELQEPPGYIRVWTYSEAKNEWTYKEYGPGGGGVVYTDQVLVRDNTEVPGMALADPSELKTQKEVNYWLDEKAGQGGGEPNLGKESKPWLEISKYGMRTSRTGWGQGFVYEVTWSCNPNCTFSWQHEIDINGDGNWIDIAAHPQKDELGFEQASETPVSVVLVQGDQASKFPNALMRFRLAGELNGILSELSSGAIAAWEERTEEYDPPMYEDGTAVDLDPYATTEYVDEKVEEYDDRYLQLNEPNNVNNQFRIKGTGGTYISTAGDELGIYHLKTPTDVTHAASKGYVDQQIAAIEIPTGGGGLPTTKYDGNRLFVVGNGVSDLNNGEVVFTNTAGNIVDNVGLVTRIVLPIDEFNWDACSKSGFVYVKNGANSRGYFQVYDVITNEGRNKMLKVKLFDFVEDTNLDPGYGHPCYFNGVFFG